MMGLYMTTVVASLEMLKKRLDLWASPTIVTVVELSSVEESLGVEEDDAGMAGTHWEEVIE